MSEAFAALPPRSEWKSLALLVAIFTAWFCLCYGGAAALAPHIPWRVHVKLPIDLSLPRSLFSENRAFGPETARRPLGAAASGSSSGPARDALVGVAGLGFLFLGHQADRSRMRRRTRPRLILGNSAASSNLPGSSEVVR